MQPLRTIDKLLNQITMYRLMVYGLATLLGGAELLSILGKLNIPGLAILASSTVILTVAYITDRLLPVVWQANANNNSSLITSLILCCILPPSTSVHNLALAGLGAFIAIVSKYVLTIRFKHIFNPAALAAIVLGLSNLLPATWWIGSAVMLPLTVVFGLLVLRKIRRYQLFLSFLIASLLVAALLGLKNHLGISYTLSTAFKSSPLIFLGTVMLTEPATSPPKTRQQGIYGAIVGALFMSQLRFGLITATPELALIVGNIYAYIVSPKFKSRLRLKSKEQLAPNIFDLGFVGASSLAFIPGQYLEWTLPREKSDNRGNRRLFSIASAPGDEELHIATKIYPKSSRFKAGLIGLKPGDEIVAGQLSGNFLLPKDMSQKLIFIAGGIGITPFVSMAKDMIKKKQKRDIVLFYLVSNASEYCYESLWQEASAYGLRTFPVLTHTGSVRKWKGPVGRLDKKMLLSAAPNYMQSRYYLSGPPGLVENYSKLLRQLRVKRHQIIVDYFSGY